MLSTMAETETAQTLSGPFPTRPINLLMERCSAFRMSDSLSHAIFALSSVNMFPLTGNLAIFDSWTEADIRRRQQDMLALLENILGALALAGWLETARCGVKLPTPGAKVRF
jgi:hypothetical protein